MISSVGINIKFFLSSKAIKMKAIVSSIFKTFFLSLCVIANTDFVYAQSSASILPPAKTQLLDNNGKPLVSGTVDFFIPGTTTRKTTWQDSGKTTANANPVVLDGGGRALMLGDGSYRQVVKDRLGNVIWDQITSSTGSGGNTPPVTFGDGQPVGTIHLWAGLISPNQYAFSYGQELSRSTYPELLSALTFDRNVNCTLGSPTLSGITTTEQLPIGSKVESTCLNPGATIVSKTISTVVMSSNAIISTNVVAKFFPWGNGDGTSTFNVPDMRGRVPVGRNNMGGIASSRMSIPGYGSNPNSLGGAGGNDAYNFPLSALPPTQLTVSSADITVLSLLTNIVQGTPINIDTVIGSGQTISAFSPGTVGSSRITSAGPLTAAATQPMNGGGPQTLTSTVQPSVTTNYIIKISPDISANSVFGVASIGGMQGVLACGTGITCSGNVISSTLNNQNATNLIYNPPWEGSISRTQQTVDTQWVSARDFGVKGDGVTDDGPAIRLAIDNAPKGATIFFPEGKYFVDTCRNGAVFDFTPAAIRNNGYTIEGVGYSWNVVGGFGSSNPPGGTVFLLGPNIPSTCDFIHRAGTTFVSGFSLKNFLVRPYIGAGAYYGRHMVHFDASASDTYTELFGSIENVYLTNNAANTGYAIKTTGNASNVGGVLNQYTIKDNILMSGINAQYVGDTVRIINNGIGANSLTGSIGITINQNVAFGFAGIVIQNNNVVNLAGRVVFGPGTGPMISGNYLETNSSTVNTTNIDLVGVTSYAMITGNMLTNNSTTNTHSAVRVGATAANTIIRDNTMTFQTGSVGVSVLSGATNTIIGWNNYILNGTSVNVATGVNNAGTNTVFDTVSGSAITCGTTGELFISAVGGAISCSGNSIVYNAGSNLLTTSYFNAVVGYRYGGSAGTTGQVLRSDGSNGFLPASLGAADMSNGTTGAGNIVLRTSAALVTPDLGTPSAANLINATGLPVNTGISGMGTGISLFLGVPSSANLASSVTDETGSGALVFATSPTLVTPNLGTPAFANLANAIGLPVTTGVTGLGTNIAAFLATPTSANLAAALTNETGSGLAVFGTSPTLITPVITGEATFNGQSSTVPGLIATSSIGPGNYMPTQRWTYNGNLAFTNMSQWVRSAGDGAFASWAQWSSTNTRWEYPLTSTYGASLQTFNDNLTGSIRYYTAPSASVTAGNPITFGQRLSVEGSGSVIVGSAALATTATDGFLYIPTMAGAPTGVPTAATGRAAMVFDTTNKKFCYYATVWECSAAFTP